MRRSGTVNLPLHGGKAPRWLFNRMVKLAEGITDTIVYEYGTGEFLQRISDPYWFQALSCALGFDWHSSGTTTTTCGALKMAINPEEHGICVAGGKGKTSRKAPTEIERVGSEFSLSSAKVESLKKASRLSAKVDNSCIQDGYQLYHHSFFFTERGDWTVVQQGMGERYARRYHWFFSKTKSKAFGFLEEPHSAICCDSIEDNVLDMTSKDSRESRDVSVDLVKDNPCHIKRYFKQTEQKTLTEYAPEFSMPAHHPVLSMDLTKQGMNTLKRAYEFQPASYEELIALRGMGPKMIRALALISDLIYGTKPSFKDPVKYSFAHGGKDGFPYPVDRATYDNSIQTLKDAIEQAKLDKKEKYRAIKRLNEFI